MEILQQDELIVEEMEIELSPEEIDGEKSLIREYFLGLRLNFVSNKFVFRAKKGPKTKS